MQRGEGEYNLARLAVFLCVFLFQLLALNGYFGCSGQKYVCNQVIPVVIPVVSCKGGYLKMNNN